MYANSTVQEDKKPPVIDGKIYIHSNNFTHGKSYNQTLQIHVKYTDNNHSNYNGTFKYHSKDKLYLIKQISLFMGLYVCHQH